uniref:Uncharacterized protein n=1 Tax=Kocuria rosea subsp. polaris TaxID=136273 RepID=A0A0A6VM52_KOCRO|nr:hypothetical protein GY22_17045 [Kocuria polaris]
MLGTVSNDAGAIRAGDDDRLVVVLFPARDDRYHVLIVGAGGQPCSLKNPEGGLLGGLKEIPLIDLASGVKRRSWSVGTAQILRDLS